MRQEKFNDRYIIKISSSVVLVLLNAIVHTTLPRAFAIEEYGYYIYNLNIFSAVVILANLSTSNATISKLSKRNNEIGLILFYLKLYLIEIVFLNIGIYLLQFTSMLRDTFVGQTLLMIFLGLEVSLALKLQNDIIGIYDSMALSRYPAIVQIIMKFFFSTFVVITCALGVLNLQFFYVGQLLLTTCMTSFLLYKVISFQKQEYPTCVDRYFFDYLSEYYYFCRPLVIASFFAQFITIVMNWMLMNWGGAREQAMFGAAWQLNTLIAMAFSPYAELSKREYALAVNNVAQTRRLYDVSLRRMFWLTSYFSMFVGFCANWALPIVYGEKYNNATDVTLLMMFYTVYQAAGQINGAFMLATERTKLSAILALLGQIVTLLLMVVFQVPNFLWPTGLGAIGIALVYAAGNFISVWIGIFKISRTICLDIKHYLGIYFLPIAVCSISAFGLNIFFDWVLNISDSLGAYMMKILLSWIIYSGLVFIIIQRNPSFAGLSDGNISALFKRFKLTKNG